MREQYRGKLEFKYSPNKEITDNTPIDAGNE